MHIHKMYVCQCNTISKARVTTHQQHIECDKTILETNDWKEQTNSLYAIIIIIGIAPAMACTPIQWTLIRCERILIEWECTQRNETKWNIDQNTNSKLWNAHRPAYTLFLSHSSSQSSIVSLSLYISIHVCVNMFSSVAGCIFYKIWYWSSS